MCRYPSVAGSRCPGGMDTDWRYRSGHPRARPGVRERSPAFLLTARPTRRSVRNAGGRQSVRPHSKQRLSDQETAAMSLHSFCEMLSP
jgi:hypothetical protein